MSEIKSNKDLFEFATGVVDTSEFAEAMFYSNYEIAVSNAIFRDQFEIIGEAALITDIFDEIELVHFYNNLEKISDTTIKYIDFIFRENTLKIRLKQFKIGEEYLFWATISTNSEQLNSTLKHELIKSKSDYQALFESVPVGLYRSSPSGALLMANSAFKKITGIEGNIEEIDLNWHTQKIDYQRDKFISEMSKFGKVVDMESVFKKNNGKEVRYIENSRVVKDEDGEIQYFEGVIIDNTDNYLIAKNLEESEEKYRLLFEKSKDAILLLSRDIWLDCNESALHLFGYESKDQIIGLHPHETSPLFQSPGILSSIKAQEMIDLAFKNGYHQFEWKHRRKDGAIFYTDVVLTVIPINGSSVLYSVLRDITEQRRYREAVITSEEKHRSFFEQSNEGLLLLNNKGKILEFNNAMEEISGFSGDFMEGRNISFFATFISAPLSKYISDDLAVLSSIEKFIEKYDANTPVFTETNFYCTSTKTALLLISIFPILSATGLMIGVVVRDVTQERRIAEEIRKAKEKYESILKTSPIPIALINLAGDALFMSPKCVDVLEIDNADECIGKTGLGFIIGPRKPYGIIESVLENEVVNNYEVELQTAKGRRFYSELNAALIRNADRDPEAILINFTDISARKETEKAKEAALKAIVDAKSKRHEALVLMDNSSKLASLGVLAGGITHEITQPLNAIKIGAEGILAWNKTGNSLPVVIVKMIEGIAGATDRVDNIIKHMRSFWIDETEEVSIIDLNETVYSALNLAKLKMQSHEITFELNLDPGTLLIKANKPQMELVINNLISNSVHSLDKLKIKNKSIRLTTLLNGNEVNLLVEDNGVGLPSVDQTKLFDPFFSTRKDEGGSGLGLAIVKMFIEKFDAKINCFNNSNGGASFFITFALK